MPTSFSSTLLFTLYCCLMLQWSYGVSRVTCDKTQLEYPAGSIVSPNSTSGREDVSYPNYANCAWYIKNQPGMIMTLSFQMFDVEESQYPCDRRPCCGETWLSLSSVRSGTFLSGDHTTGVGVNNEGQVVNARYCGRNLQIPPLFFTGTGLIVTFKSGHNTSGARGFRIDYLIDKPTRFKCEAERFRCDNGKCVLRDWLCNGWDECGDGSDEHNCTTGCRTGTVRCGASRICYDEAAGRCNGISDCPDGEDERGCNSAGDCGERLACRSGRMSGCYSVTQRCDGVPHCADGSDEEACDAAFCGPHRDGFLCRDRRCVPSTSRCNGIRDCDDFSDEEACMKMSVVTAVILGSLLCGLLLVIAAGCGLRLYHLRLALEQRWAAIRQQHHIINNDGVDEFGQRRPVMGRQPPPTYAQAMGVATTATLAADSTVVTAAIPRHHCQRSRRHSRRSRRPGELSVAVTCAVQVSVPSTAALADPGVARIQVDARQSLLSRLWRSWKKRWRQADDHANVAGSGGAGATSVTPSSSAASEVEQCGDLVALDRVANSFVAADEGDTQLLIESRS